MIDDNKVAITVVNTNINTITDTEIILTDSLNDDDKYVIKIMSGNIFVEKVGE